MILTDAEREVLEFPTWHITPGGDISGGIDVALFRGGNHPPVKMPERLRWFLDAAIEEIEKHIRLDEYRPGGSLYLKSFSIRVGNIRARCQESIGANRISTFALRLTSNRPPAFSELGLPDYIQTALLNPDMHRRGGLVTIFGPQGSGKTWTAYATLIEYLKTFGGSGYTIEDPIEFDIRGWIGDKGGYLVQSDCTEIGYSQAVINSLRFARSILFIGEIRDSVAAAEMLRIAVSGQLVLTTMHAKDHQSMCQRLISLAQDGGEPQAKNLLANALQLSVGQQLNHGVLQASMLHVSGHSDVRAAIEKGDYTAFANALERQRAERSLMNGGLGMRNIRV